MSSTQTSSEEKEIDLEASRGSNLEKEAKVGESDDETPSSQLRRAEQTVKVDTKPSQATDFPDGLGNHELVANL
jgi:hypothetical protein